MKSDPFFSGESKPPRQPIGFIGIALAVMVGVLLANEVRALLGLAFDLLTSNLVWR